MKELPLQEKLKEIKRAFQWTWDNQGTEHTADHFNIPANGIELLIEVIREAEIWAGEFRDFINTINEQAHEIVELEQEAGSFKDGYVERNNEGNRLKAENERLVKMIEQELKLQMRLNMPRLSGVELEETWQRYKKLNNL